MGFSRGQVRPLSFLTLDELGNLPPVPWLVEGVLPAGATALMYGRRGSGKSFVALDLAGRIAAGLEWHGRPTSPARVVYIAAEGRGGITARLKAWHARFAEEAAVLVCPEAVPLVVGHSANRIVEAAREAFGDELSTHPLLLVVDTLHRSIPGGEENSEATASSVYATLADIRQSIPLLTVLLVHHPQKGEGAAGSSARGSGAWEDDADTVMRLERDGDSRSVVLRCTKQKDAEEFEPIGMELEPYEGSLVVVPSNNWRTEDRRTLTPGERTALRALDEWRGKSLSWTRWSTTAGLSASSLGKHRRRLLDLGYVQESGTSRRPEYSITGSGIAALIP